MKVKDVLSRNVLSHFIIVQYIMNVALFVVSDLVLHLFSI